MVYFRFTAVIPLALSITASVLLGLLIEAGTKPGKSQDLYIVSLNVSKIGSQLIQFNAAATTTSAAASATATDLGSSIINGIEQGLNGIIGNVTDAVDSNLQTVESQLISDVVSSLGIRDNYVFFLRNLCEGDYISPDDPSSSVDYTDCPSIQDSTAGLSNISANTPSYVVVGTTNISMPILQSIGSSLGSINDLVSSLTKANVAFLIIGLVFSSLVGLLSLLSIAFGRAWYLGTAAMICSYVAPGAILTSAILTTSIVAAVTGSVNGLSAALTVSAQGGSKAQAFAWASFALALVAQFYWVLTWFVSYRQTAVVRIRRAPEELGRVRATFRLAWQRMRVKEKTEKKQMVDA
ncbi:hypothetical protein BX600DRAFT_541987 [Xylariales sp. PMI_506]|nr:hypothetical protein BX600DRAFT_541987 [Xylariales sp. PMI_506]